MTFKSGASGMIVGFIKRVIMLCFIEAMLLGLLLLLLSKTGMYIDWDSGALITTFLILAGITIVVSLWWTFYHNNIKVEITTDAVRFLRGKREFQYFSFAACRFGSFVHKQSYNLIPVSTSRYLRVVQLPGGSAKDYPCYYFSRKVFEDLCASINVKQDEFAGKYNQAAATGESAVSEPTPSAVPAAAAAQVFQMTEPSTAADTTYQTGPAATTQTTPQYNLKNAHSTATAPVSAPTPATAQPNEQRTFNVNKQLLVNRYKKPLLIMTFSFVGFILLLLVLMIITDRGMTGRIGFYIFFCVFLGAIMIPIPLIIFGRPLGKIKKGTPEKIVIYSNCLLLDDKVFYFSQIKQIKVTPPSYSGSGTRILRRRITIDDGYKKSVFIVGDDRDLINRKNKPKIFEDYTDFCNELKAALINEPHKFVMELA